MGSGGGTGHSSLPMRVACGDWEQGEVAVPAMPVCPDGWGECDREPGGGGGVVAAVRAPLKPALVGSLNPFTTTAERNWFLCDPARLRPAPPSPLHTAERIIYLHLTCHRIHKPFPYTVILPV